MGKFLQKYFKKGITSILILSIFLSLSLPFSIIYAQSVNGSYGTTGGGFGSFSAGAGGTGGIGASITTLSPLIANLPLCREKVASKIKTLFSGATSAIQTQEQKERYSSLGPDDDANFAESIDTSDKAVKKEIGGVRADTKQILKQTSELNENDTCLKSIGRLVSKMLLQKMTVSTIEWINNGFDGKPLFLQNPGKFFGDIATNELLQFKLEIDDARAYPFGRAFLKSQVNAITNKFSDNARYSLNELISQTTPQYDAISFEANFSKGGWSAWNALTQVPANNPIGFNILASTELTKRLEGTSFSKGEEVQKALDQAGGFLGDERCVDPEGITRAEHNAALIKGEKEYKVIGEISTGYGDEVVEQTAPTGYIIGTCKKWEYVTPGKLIAESATKTIGYTDNTLLAADDLNSSIAAIMDALLNKWGADIANKGFANFDTVGANGSFIYDDDNATTGSFSQVDLDFPKSFTNSSWLKENPNFNIRTDLTQALIDEQRIYQQRLQEENETLNDLIITVRQLDYCIPGPHPGWEDDSEIALNKEINKIPSKTAEELEELSKDQITKTAGQFFNFISLGAFDSLVGLYESLTGTTKYHKLHWYYAAIVYSSVGLRIYDEPPTLRKSEVANGFSEMLNRYAKLIKKYYTRDFLPTVTPQARTEFRKIAGYQQKIDNNEYAIYTLTGIINRLSRLKDKLDQLNPEDTEYETYLPMINEFGRLSASMVTGNDIARVIDDVKEESDQIKYVYDDLLTGPYGCEKDLEKRTYTDPKQEKLANTLRATYPFTILYDYNSLAKGARIPTPDQKFIDKYNLNVPKEPNLMSIYHPGPFNPDLKTTVDNNSEAFGPGFLSRVYYNWTTTNEDPPRQVLCEEAVNGKPGDNLPYTEAIDCMVVSDIFYKIDRYPVTVGRKQGKTINNEDTSKNGQKAYSFEQLIGIY